MRKLTGLTERCQENGQIGRWYSLHSEARAFWRAGSSVASPYQDSPARTLIAVGIGRQVSFAQTRPRRVTQRFTAIAYIPRNLWFCRPKPEGRIVPCKNTGTSSTLGF